MLCDDKHSMLAVCVDISASYPKLRKGNKNKVLFVLYFLVKFTLHHLFFCFYRYSVKKNSTQSYKLEQCFQNGGGTF